MSITALTWAAFYLGSIALALLLNPLFGALGYQLEYYMRPSLKWWGDELPGLRYNLIVCSVLGATFFLHRARLQPLMDVEKGPARWLLALGTTMVVVTALFSVDREISWNWTVQWWKIAVIFPLLVYGVVRTKAGFTAFITMHVLGAFWWGWQAYVDPKREAGRLMSIGSGDSFDDNGAAAHLLTVLPFVVVLALTENDKRLRLIGLIAAPFIVNTIILCNSRGSMVGLLVAGLATLLLIKTGYRKRVAIAGLGVGVAFFALADQQFIDRQRSTTNYEEDGSAQQRLTTWVASMNLVADHPFGTGGRGFHLLSPAYIPEIVEAHGGEGRAPHNTYAMVASEYGLLGLFSYLGLHISVLLMLQRVKKAAAAENADFFYWRALAVQAALIAFLVAGFFSDRLYAEAGYWMIGLALALRRIHATERAQETASARETVDRVTFRGWRPVTTAQ